jgi:hypothetical protein
LAFQDLLNTTSVLMKRGQDDFSGKGDSKAGRLFHFTAINKK